MKRSTLIILKTLTWIACLAPLAVLATKVRTAADPAALITHSNGYTALVLIAVTLAITPVRKLIPKLGWLVRFRRLLGLFAFFYATVHILDYFALYVGFDFHRVLEDLSKRRYIIAGASAWLLLLLLALTSTSWSIRKLGGKRWSWLHRLIYLAAMLGLVHFWWQVKPGVLLPLPLTIVIGILLLVRVIFALWQWMKKKKPVRAELLEGQ